MCSKFSIRCPDLWVSSALAAPACVFCKLALTCLALSLRACFLHKGFEIQGIHSENMEIATKQCWCLVIVRNIPLELKLFFLNHYSSAHGVYGVYRWQLGFFLSWPSALHAATERIQPEQTLLTDGSRANLNPAPGDVLSAARVSRPLHNENQSNFGKPIRKPKCLYVQSFQICCSWDFKICTRACTAFTRCSCAALGHAVSHMFFTSTQFHYCKCNEPFFERGFAKCKSEQETLAFSNRLMSAAPGIRQESSRSG